MSPFFGAPDQVIRASPTHHIAPFGLVSDDDAQSVREAALERLSPEARHKYAFMQSQGHVLDTPNTVPMLVVDKMTGTVQHKNDADADEGDIIRPDAFERLSPAAKTKYMQTKSSSRTSSDERIRPFLGANARTSASQTPPANPGFEHKVNWLSQQVQHYGSSVQDYGAAPEAVAYSTEQPAPKNKPIVLDTSPRIVPVLYHEDASSKEALRTLMAMMLGLRLEHCRPASNEVSAGLRVDYVSPDSVAAAVAPSDQIKVGDVIIYIQDYSVETIPAKTAADALRLFGKLSGVSMSSLANTLRLRLLRADPGFNEHGGINWTEHQVTLVRPAHKRDHKDLLAEIRDVDYRPSTVETQKYMPNMHHAQPPARAPVQTYHPTDWSDALDFATKAARHFEDEEVAKQRASELERRQQARKELEAQVDEHLKEALAQLHAIDKKDLLEHKEFLGKQAQDEGVHDAAARAQRLLDEETYLDYQRLRAENERLQREREALDCLRRENKELKEGINFEVKKVLNAERVDKERLQAENAMLRGLMPKIMSPVISPDADTRSTSPITPHPPANLLSANTNVRMSEGVKKLRHEAQALAGLHSRQVVSSPLSQRQPLATRPSPSSPMASTAQRRAVIVGTKGVGAEEKEAEQLARNLPIYRRPLPSPPQGAQRAHLDSKTKDLQESTPDAISSSELRASPASEVPRSAMTQSELERLFRQRGNNGRMSSEESKSESKSANSSPALAPSTNPSAAATTPTHTGNRETGRKTQAQLAALYTASQTSHGLRPQTHAPVDTFSPGSDLW